MKICAEKFIAYLKEKNLNFNTKEYEDGTVRVSFPYQGKVTDCIFNGDQGEYLSLYNVMENTKKEKRGQILEACNKVHTEYKWITLYVDDDDDLVAHHDAIVSPDDDGTEAFELLIRLVQIIDKLQGDLMQAIYL